jgi:hypothetical protein
MTYLHLLVLVFLVSIPQCASDFIPAESMDFWVDVISWHAKYYSSCEEDATISGNFEVTSGSDIDFFICDSENYDKWCNLEDATAYNIKYNIGSLDFSFTVPADGRWYIVFVNDAWLTRKHIEGNIYYHAPQSAEYNPIVGLAILGGVGGFALVFVILYKLFHTEQKPQPQVPIRRYVETSQPPQTQFMYCPHCGKPVHSTMKFCPNCGGSTGPPPEIT